VVPVVAYLLASTTLKLMLMVLRGRGLPSSNSLPGARNRLEPAAVIANGYMYVIGGTDNGGNAQATVYYAKLNADGHWCLADE